MLKLTPEQRLIRGERIDARRYRRRQLARRIGLWSRTERGALPYGYPPS